MVTLVLHAAAYNGILWLSKPPTKILKQVGLLVQSLYTLKGGYRSMLWNCKPLSLFLKQKCLTARDRIPHFFFQKKNRLESVEFTMFTTPAI